MSPLYILVVFLALPAILEGMRQQVYGFRDSDNEDNEEHIHSLNSIRDGMPSVNTTGLDGGSSSTVSSDHRDIKVKLWTWNSGKKSLAEEAEKLAEGLRDPDTEDVLVTCQQEAEEPIKKYIDNEKHKMAWVLVSHAEHWGKTGAFRPWNAQFISVFVRQPQDYTSELSVEAPASAYAAAMSMNYPSEDASDWAIINKRTEAVVTPVMKVKARAHKTDFKGKGGASAEIVWFENGGRKETRVAFLCAHLDSASGGKREAGIVNMMLDFKVGFDHGNLAETILKDDSMCGLWDESAECPVPPATAPQDDFDAVVMFGDLNYRIHQDGIVSNEMASKIVSAEGRRSLKINDPLNPSAWHPDLLVQKVVDGGFGFQCNQPQEAFLPSYRRYGGDVCAQLGEAVRECGGFDQEPCSQEVLNLATQCYSKKGEFQTKGDDWQLGWLDRFCFRTMGLADLSIGITNEEAWAATPGEANKVSGADHMAVMARLTFKPRNCRVPDLSPHSTVAARDRGSGTQLLWLPRGTSQDEKHTFECDAGYHAVDPAVSVSTAFDPWTAFALAVACSEDGLIRSSAGTPISKLQCKRVCMNFEPLDSPKPVTWRSPREDSLVLLEGEELSFSCDTGDKLLGSSAATCGDNGEYNIAVKGAGDEGEKVDADGAANIAPMCVQTCRLPGGGTRADLRRLAVTNPVLDMYAKEVADLPADVVVGGGSFTMGCKHECLLIGNSELSCPVDSPELVPAVSTLACACSVQLKVISVETFPTSIVDLANTFKLKVFSRAVFRAKGINLNSDADLMKAYWGIDGDSAAKFKVKDFSEPGVSRARKTFEEGKDIHVRVQDLVNEGLEDAFLHLTVCATKGGTSLSWSSSCKVSAMSFYTGVDVASILRSADGGSEVTVDFPLQVDSNFELGDNGANPVAKITFEVALNA